MKTALLALALALSASAAQAQAQAPVEAEVAPSNFCGQAQVEKWMLNTDVGRQLREANLARALAQVEAQWRLQMQQRESSASTVEKT
jgi:hypothetical protein